MKHTRALVCSGLVFVLANAACGETAGAERSGGSPPQPQGAAGAGAEASAGSAAGTDSGATGPLGSPQPAAPLTCATTNAEPWRDGPGSGCEFPLLWSRTVQATDVSGLQIVHLDVDANANLVLAVTLRGEVSWEGRRVGSAHRSSLFVAIYAPNGMLETLHVMPDASGDAIAVDRDQQLCVAGTADAPGALPQVLNPEDAGQSFVTCWSSDGAPRWSRRLDAFIHEIAFDRAGNLFAVSAESDVEEIAEVTTLSSFDAGGTPRWSKVLTRTGTRGTVAGHPDGSIIFASEIGDSLDLGTMRLTNTRSNLASTAVAGLDADGNGLWAVLEEEWFWGPLLVAPSGEILLRLFNATQRYDARGVRLGDPVSERVDAAIPNGFLTASSSRTGAVIGWKFERLDPNLVLQSVTTHALTEGTPETSRPAAVAGAPTGEVYVASIHGDLLAIARIAPP